MAQPFSKQAEEELLDAVRDVTGRVEEDNLDPTEAIAKVASERELPLTYVPLLVQAYNVGRCTYQREHGGSGVLRKTADFPVARIEDVMARLCPEKPLSPALKKASVEVSDEYSRPPMWAAHRQMEKSAGAAALLGPGVSNVVHEINPAGGSTTFGNRLRNFGNMVTRPGGIGGAIARGIAGKLGAGQTNRIPEPMQPPPPIPSPGLFEQDRLMRREQDGLGPRPNLLFKGSEVHTYDSAGDPQIKAVKAFGKADRVKMAVEEARRQAAAARDRMLASFGVLRDYFKQASYLRRPFVQAKLWLQHVIAGEPRFPAAAEVDAELDREVHAAPPPATAGQPAQPAQPSAQSAVAGSGLS